MFLVEVLKLILCLLLLGGIYGVFLIARQRHRLTIAPPPGPHPRPRTDLGQRWAALAERDDRFRQALELRRHIRALVDLHRPTSTGGDDSRLAELLDGVDRILLRIEANLTVLEQTADHLRSFEPERLAEQEATLRRKLEQTEDPDVQRLTEDSLRQLEHQQELRDAIQARGERLLSGVDHSLVQLQALHLDLINIFSAGVQTEAGQLTLLRERIRQLAEELGQHAAQSDEFAHLLIEDEQPVGVGNR